jgi:hypothetical protein
MNEFRDLSRLPEDPEYWAQLEARVVAGLSDGRDPPASAGWWSPLEPAAIGLGATALAALLAVLLLLPPRTTALDAGTLLLLAPADPELHALVTSPTPPSLASLVLPAAGRGSR